MVAKGICVAMRIKYDDGLEISYHYVTSVRLFKNCDMCNLSNPSPTNLRVKDYYKNHPQAPSSYPICLDCLDKWYLGKQNIEIDWEL